MPFSKTVVINCAGIGSRLGLGQTKTLVDINGQPLIYWQLEQLHNVKNIRIVVGYQAKQVMNTVLKKRKDVVFVYNHNYLHTKMATSLYLGSINSHSMVLSIDGDMLIHPADMRNCLEEEEEFIGCTHIESDDPVYAQLKNDNVVKFSRENGDCEYSGPTQLSNSRMDSNKDKHLYEIVEKHLPIPVKIIRAIDIDTAEDHKKATTLFTQWQSET